MGRGFGIPATTDAERAGRVAAECERLGYTSIWSNDVPNADGIRTAGYMAEAATDLPVGVGVVPFDRRPARDIVRLVGRLAIPLDRLILGVGAGQSKKPLQTVKEAVSVLRAELSPELTIAVAAMGPRMCRLAGSIADVVLFNWMLPERIEWARRHVAAGERRRREPGGVVKAAYIRVALEPGASERLEAEAARYNRIPVYRAHFAAMGVPLARVGVAAPPAEIAARLGAYDRVLDEAIVRAVPALDSIEDTLAVAEVGAPARPVRASPPE
jgi:alkanesulfonate monooxygenase SsuD/methylene tetrahydromethanopterin reductase-like flavin-dependent oxidoreductase (luciferase family)